MATVGRENGEGGYIEGVWACSYFCIFFFSVGGAVRLGRGGGDLGGGGGHRFQAHGYAADDLPCFLPFGLIFRRGFFRRTTWSVSPQCDIRERERLLWGAEEGGVEGVWVADGEESGC